MSSEIGKIHPDILLLDINMPEMNGIEVLEELKRREDPLKVLILTVHSEVEYLVKAVDIGANGYILKDSGSSELKQAINVIMSGESYIQPSLLPALNSRLINRDVDQDKLQTLTKRELEILTQVAGGMFNKEIAVNLNISERTVKNHISNIFRKIDVSDRTQAAVLLSEIILLNCINYFKLKKFHIRQVKRHNIMALFSIRERSFILKCFT